MYISSYSVYNLLLNLLLCIAIILLWKTFPPMQFLVFAVIKKNKWYLYIDPIFSHFTKVSSCSEWFLKAKNFGIILDTCFSHTLHQLISNLPSKYIQHVTTLYLYLSYHTANHSIPYLIIPKLFQYQCFTLP